MTMAFGTLFSLRLLCELSFAVMWRREARATLLNFMEKLRNKFIDIFLKKIGVFVEENRHL